MASRITKNAAPSANFQRLRNASLLDSRGFIAGEWRHAAEGRTFNVYEPSSGEVLHPVADFGHSDFVRAIDSAYEGYQSFYADTTAKERGAMLSRWHSLILDNADDCE
jgi:succinate-semialdehyde dehydrogenase/glutarate-semialdehyde dehydrogenase